MSRRRASSPIGTGLSPPVRPSSVSAFNAYGLLAVIDSIYFHSMPAVRRFGPPLALMALIFFLSAQPDLSSGLGGWDLILRKLAHMTEYALLYLLWLRALPAAPPWAPVAIALGYAVTDEIHQGFVHGRHASPVDVLIDGFGIALGIVAATIAQRRTR